MSKRVIKNRPALRDWHLWTEVKRSVHPLRPEPVEPPEPEPLPIPAAKPPPVFSKNLKWTGPSLPPFRPVSRSARTEPGREIEPRLRRALVRGRIDIDATIDLHGMRQGEAHAALKRFIKARVLQGDRTILVITGKGLSRADDMQMVEKGVLRSMLPIWLSQPDLAPMIGGWDAAAQGHGGQGAYYVRLRRVER